MTKSQSIEVREGLEDLSRARSAQAASPCVPPLPSPSIIWMQTQCGSGTWWSPKKEEDGSPSGDVEESHLSERTAHLGPTGEQKIHFCHVQLLKSGGLLSQLRLQTTQGLRMCPPEGVKPPTGSYSEPRIKSSLNRNETSQRNKSYE